MWIETEHGEFFNLGPGTVQRVYVCKTPKGTPREDWRWEIKAVYLSGSKCGADVHVLLSVNPTEEGAVDRFEANLEMFRKALLGQSPGGGTRFSSDEIVGVSFNAAEMIVRPYGASR